VPFGSLTAPSATHRPTLHDEEPVIQEIAKLKRTWDSCLSGTFGGMRSSWRSGRRPAHRRDEGDRGCPPGTGCVRPMWHVGGMIGRANATRTWRRYGCCRWRQEFPPRAAAGRPGRQPALLSPSRPRRRRRLGGQQRRTAAGLGSTVIHAFIGERPPHRGGQLSLVGTAGAPRARHGEPHPDGEQSQRDEADVPHGEHSKAYRLARG
jgi:hypothetical protein